MKEDTELVWTASRNLTRIRVSLETLNGVTFDDLGACERLTKIYEGFAELMDYLEESMDRSS